MKRNVEYDNQKVQLCIFHFYWLLKNFFFIQQKFLRYKYEIHFYSNFCQFFFVSGVSEGNKT